jgi:nucleoside-diphosphate-sugar epimerase
MWTEEKLNELLTTPSEALIEDMKRIKGDITVLGAGGKMGPTLCVLAKNAIRAAGVQKRVIAVSRGSDPIAIELLQKNDVEFVACDLLDKESLYALEETENVIFMAGKKFGTDGNEWQTWGMNATLPTFVADKFKKSNVVVFSSGNVYPIVPLSQGGCTEAIKPEPVGEYAMSCLARERAFEYAANTYGTKVLIYRLNFAVDLRYGVLYDIAERIWNDQPVTLHVPAFNCVWQRYVNEAAIGALMMASADVERLNVTGPEQYSTREAAEKLAAALGKPVTFLDDEGTCGLLSCADKCVKAFGMPDKTVDEMIVMQAEWMKSGGRQLDKPTHFQETKGNF